MPLAEEGQTIEPSVSVPMVAAARPAAIAAPDPAEDPQGLRSSTCGLRVWPPTALQPDVDEFERKLAHSLRLVLPRMTAPAARSRATSGASRPVTFSCSASEPAVVGMGSAESILSLSRIGTPCSGPLLTPCASNASSACASASALGLSASTAFSIGPASSTAAMRSRKACTTAADVVFFAAMSAAMSTRDFGSATRAEKSSLSKAACGASGWQAATRKSETLARIFFNDAPPDAAREHITARFACRDHNVRGARINFACQNLNRRAGAVNVRANLA